MRVTGKFLKDHLGKRVSIIGKILEANGTKCKLESACGMTVKINFNEEPENSLVNQVVEIIGVIKAADTIAVDEFLEFPLEFTQDYDKATHSVAVDIEQQYGSKFWADVAFAEAEAVTK
ncbi:uncharacterized protein LOC100901029 [Galendromus occidentalis]|uniref:Uncharacterized protein LOC100901029 n=1 Tax=Galendromus occidentalis TaxID=34638 RepID=A0AAJ6VYM7_9ACAR|nr:uncharacterized protein LOC100901029 [Galendromus occidentalis]